MSRYIRGNGVRINLGRFELPWPWDNTVGVREWLRVYDAFRETAILSVVACATIAIGCGIILLPFLWR
jgi:hypothetical protein